MEQNEQQKVMKSEELKVKFNIIIRALDEVSKKNEQLEAENVNLKESMVKHTEASPTT